MSPFIRLMRRAYCVICKEIDECDPLNYHDAERYCFLWAAADAIAAIISHDEGLREALL